MRKKRLALDEQVIANQNNEIDRLLKEKQALQAEFSRYQCLNVNPFRPMGLELIDLGARMLDPSSNVKDLAEHAHRLGLILKFRLEGESE